MSHTPGSWNTSRDAVPADHVQITVYAEADGQRVATAFREEANARLIAAAPDLLAALERATQWADADDCCRACARTDGRHEADCWNAEARAAINKAKGNA